MAAVLAQGTEGGAVEFGARAGLVDRPRLVDDLTAAADVPVVLVVAAGGFGKTTLVSQWLGGDHRSVAWLTATRQHDDPAVLLADELFVSRNTVKSQAVSVYRKLDVSSRGPAVEAARALGLLEE